MKNLMKISRKTDNALYITGWILIIAALSVTLAGPPGLRFLLRLPPCLLHVVTGLYCPGCGGTRAVLALAQGNLLLSLRYHPLVLPSAAAAAWFMISQTIARLSRGRLNVGMHFREIYLWIALCIVIVNFLVKNLALLIRNIDLMPGQI